MELPRNLPIVTDSQHLDEPLWDRVRGALRRSFSRFGAQLDELDDLAEESLAKIFEKPRTFPVPQMLMSFAQKVGRNLWLDRVRRERTRPRTVNDPGLLAERMDGAGNAGEPSREAEMREDAARLRAAIQRLPNRHRLVLEAVLIDGLGYADVAVRLGIPRGTVKSRVHYAVREVRRVLGIAAPLDVAVEDPAA